jgi:transposase-like protein
MENNYAPQTLLEAGKYFSDPDTCLKFIVELRWPNGVICPRCQALDPHFISTRKMWRCNGCKKQFSVKVGTIFEDSPLPLEKWFAAVWLIAGAKNGISSYEIHRALGITQKSAWFVLHRVRLAMRTGMFEKMKGEVESDETYIGGKARNMHKAKREKAIQGRGAVGKSIVQGLLERHSSPSKVKAKVVPNARKGTVQAEIRENVALGSEVFTDSLASYEGLEPDYVHEAINHAEAYVRGKVHTNGLENFWSLLKRMIRGTYIHLAPFHLQKYLDEESFRFNERLGNDGQRFLRVLAGIVGRRLTYKELTGKLDIAETKDAERENNDDCQGFST